MASAFVTLSADEQELKAAFRQLVRAFGGMDATAVATGYAQSTVSDWASAQKAAFAPLHVVSQLEACTVGHPGHPHVTRLLARRAGFLLVERHDDAQAVHPLAGIAAIAAELGDVSRVVAAAAADGEVDDTERCAALNAVRALEAATAALRVALGGSKATGKPTGTRRRAD